MQKIKSSSIIKYIIYLFSIITYLFIYRKISIQYLDEGSLQTYISLLRTTDMNRFIVKTIMIYIFGVILALPNILVTIKKKGRIKFKAGMFIVIGLPALIISLGITVDLSILTGHMNLLSGKFLYWLSYGVPRYFSGFLFGYTISLCFVKEDNKNSNLIIKDTSIDKE